MNGHVKIHDWLGMLVAMPFRLTWLVAAAAGLVLAGCGPLNRSVVIEPAPGYGTAHPTTHARTPVPGGSYVVRKGDTLYSIAFRNSVDFRDLAQWNQIAEPYTIWPGQTLALSPRRAAARAGSTSAAAAPVTASHAPASTAAPGATASAPVFEPVAPAGANAATPPAASTSGAPSATPVASASTGVVPVAGASSGATKTPSPPPAAPSAVPPAASRTVGALVWRWPAPGAVARQFKPGDAIPGIEIAGAAGDPVRAAADGVVVYSGNGLVGYGELVIVKHSDSMLSAYSHNRKRLVKEGQRVTAGQQIAEMGSTGAERNGLGFQIRKDGNPVDPLAYLPAR